MKKNQWKKPYRVKKKKSILKSRYFRPFLLIAFLALGIFYLAFFSPLFQLKRVEISGNQKIETQAIDSAVYEKMSKKILFFETSSIFLTISQDINKALLSAYPQIDSVAIKKDIFGQISLIIKEKQPLAVIFNKDNYYYVDQDGIIFEKIQEQDSEKIKIQSYDFPQEFNLGEKVIEPDALSEILKIKGSMAKLEVFAAEADIISDQRLNIKTSEGWEVYFNLKGDLNWQITELKTVLENKIPSQKRRNLEYIDLRFNDMIFVSPEGITGD
jgi:hypothetical protein